MSQTMTQSDPIHDIAAVLDGPRTPNIVTRTRPQFGYIDIKGKIGKAATATILSETGYVVSGVSSDIDELAVDETRVWFEPVDELDSLLDSEQ